MKKAVRWLEIEISGKGPSPRAAGSCTRISDNEILFFGGYCADDNVGYYNDIFILNLSKREWRDATNEFSGQRPPARSGHAAILVGRRLFIFGGSHYFRSKTHYNDLYYLDLDEKRWVQPTTKGDIPSPRTQCSASLIGTKIWFFGGDLLYPNIFFNDLFEFDTETFRWRKWFPSGDIPMPRVGHSASVFEKKIYFWGGHSEPEGDSFGAQKFNDLYVLDTEKMEFTLLRQKGSVPSPRAWHSAQMSDNTQTMNGKIYIFGGTANGETFNDVYALDIKTLTWKKCHMMGVPSRPTYFHLSAKIYNKILLWGGVQNVDDDSKPLPSRYSGSLRFFEIPEVETPVICELPSTFMCDIQRLFNNPKFSDVRFLLDAHQFYAHRVILSVLCSDLLKLPHTINHLDMMNISLNNYAIAPITFSSFLEWVYCFPLDQIVMKRKHLISPQVLLSNLEALLQRLNIKFYREKEISVVATVIQQQETFQRFQEERKLKDKERQMTLELERRKKLEWLKSTIPRLGLQGPSSDEELLSVYRFVKQLADIAGIEFPSYQSVSVTPTPSPAHATSPTSNNNNNNSYTITNNMQLSMIKDMSFPPPQELSFVPFDVIFLVEKKPIGAHKGILYTRCPHFKIMFDSGMMESHLKEITIPQEKFSIFNDMIRYLYTDKFENITSYSPENLLDMIALANSYELYHLASVCEVAFLAKDPINEENVVDFLLYSEVHLTNQIFEVCIDFVARHWESLSKLDEVKKLKKKLREKIEFLYWWQYKRHPLLEKPDCK
jgi:N-acetylneuraminic acid mutarotase